jgi:hypothetical protein
MAEIRIHTLPKDVQKALGSTLVPGATSSLTKAGVTQAASSRILRDEMVFCANKHQMKGLPASFSSILSPPISTRPESMRTKRACKMVLSEGTNHVRSCKSFRQGRIGSSQAWMKLLSVFASRSSMVNICDGLGPQPAGEITCYAYDSKHAFCVPWLLHRSNKYKILAAPPWLWLESTFPVVLPQQALIWRWK